MSSDKVLALVRYYAREGYSRQLQTVCNEVLKKRANDPVLVFWRAYGMLMEGSSPEALRELRAVSTVPDLELAAAAAMIQAHETAKVVDQDAVMELQTKLEVEESTASDAAAMHLASYYSLTKSKERARGLVERVLRLSPDYGPALVLLGWCILGQHEDPEYAALVDEGELDEAIQSFEAALASDPNDLEAMLGRAKVAEVRHNLAGALEGLTEVSVRFAWFMPALVEKTRLLLAQGDWDQANDTIAHILSVDNQNIMAIAWQALHCITREGNNKQAVKLMQDLFAAINRAEPRNAELYLRLAKPFGRLAGSDTNLLTVTSMMAERSVQLRPDHAPYLVEAGYQKLFLEEWGAAAEKFNAALAVDELSLDASAGALEASIQLGELDEAASQAMFLQEMYQSQASLSSGKDKDMMADVEPPTLLYLKGLLAWKQGDTQAGLPFLERALMGHFQAASNMPLSFEMYSALWPGRVTGVVRLLLSGVGGEPRAPTEAPSPLISKCTRALELLNKHAPSLMEASVLSAKALYLAGALDAAQRKAQDILRTNPEEHSVHLLICSIYAHQDKPQLALAALDQAVSANFAVRETPLFHIVSARVHMSSGRLEEARKVLETAMNLPGVRTPMTPQQRARLVRRVTEPTLYERATVYLLLAECLGRLSKLPDAPEAKKYISDAIREFEGTSEEVRVTIADGELAIARGDVEGAIKKLRKIPSSSPHFMRARMAMADILLRHRKDKAGYVRCYIELVEVNQDYDSYCMLGEAFMQIQEPEKAVRAFEAALEFNPKDTELITRVARALVTTHDYQRALDYYNKAIFSSRSHYGLQLELAGLLVRLRQWAPAVTALNKVLERPRDASAAGGGGGSGVEGLNIDVESWMAMARVYQGSGDMDNYVEALNKALDLQKTLLTRMRGEVLEAVQAARDKAAAICYDLAEHHKRLRKFDTAMEYYQEALRNCDTHSRSMLAAAQLHLANGNVDACQQMCVALLKADPENEEAAIMLAELMFHKEHYDTAIYHFQQLLERCPSHWGALSQLIGLLRRAGRLDDVPRYFSAAEAASPKSVMEPGYHYCKGLLHRWTNAPREALKAFNFARKDTKWGAQALLHMVEIYLNPDNDAIWAEKDGDDTPDQREAIATARSLLSQVRQQDTHSQRYQVLDAYARMATKDPQQIDAALNTLLDMANQDANNVPVLLAMATGFMLLRQTPKARNQLKRLQKIPYKPDEAEEFERGWLLLAELHIQGGKFDLAQDLCQKCLKYNKSCAKAWEHMGAIMEREQAYKDAAEHYEKAWKYENQASAAVGFKLAFNYLKAKRFVEAIDVCHKVIKAFPDYPKIRKEVLEKARQGLKP